MNRIKNAITSNGNIFLKLTFVVISSYLFSLFLSSIDGELSGLRSLSLGLLWLILLICDAIMVADAVSSVFFVFSKKDILCLFYPLYWIDDVDEIGTRTNAP